MTTIERRRVARAEMTLEEREHERQTDDVAK